MDRCQGTCTWFGGYQWPPMHEVASADLHMARPAKRNDGLPQKSPLDVTGWPAQSVACGLIGCEPSFWHK